MAHPFGLKASQTPRGGVVSIWGQGEAVEILATYSDSNGKADGDEHDSVMPVVFDATTFHTKYGFSN